MRPIFKPAGVADYFSNSLSISRYKAAKSGSPTKVFRISPFLLMKNEVGYTLVPKALPTLPSASYITAKGSPRLAA